MDIIREVQKIEGAIIKWRRELHQFPELGLDLPQTSKYVCGKLQEMGIEYQSNIAGSGIVGVIKGRSEGKTIAIRADMDGLPIEEKTGLPFASKNGNMHACGHDAHTAILLGAAKVLQENKEKFRGNVKLIFQPGEEGPGGAKPMIEEGVLENPKVSAILGLHVNTVIEEIRSGGVGLSYGEVMPCADKFYLKIKGRGSHGAAPHAGVDPITIASQVITALQTIVSREIKPMNSAVITIGKIQGGEAFNIIPDEVDLMGTVRAIKRSDQEIIKERMEELIASICRGMRGSYQFHYIYGYPPLLNDYSFTTGFKKSINKILDEEDIFEITTPVTMGGEDMAFFLERVPGNYFFLGARDDSREVLYPHHNARYELNEKVLWRGSAIFVQGVLDWLEENN